MRAGKQDGEAQIMHSGETGLWLNAAGQLRLTSAGNTFEAGNAPLTDNAWHHVALNVLRNGNAGEKVPARAAAGYNDVLVSVTHEREG